MDTFKMAITTVLALIFIDYGPDGREIILAVNSNLGE
jgi:hypothetical protein